jgi:hypothetical protein
MMKFLKVLGVLAFLLCESSMLLAQKPQLLDNTLKVVKKKNMATFTRTLTPIDAQTFKSEVRSFDGALKCTGTYIKDNDAFYEHGEFVFYYSDGQIESRGRYEQGLKVGVWERYMANGTRKADRYYNPESTTLIRQVMTE